MEETDIEPHYDLSLNHPMFNNQNEKNNDNKDENEMTLNFIKPSNKRRRTNQMSSSNKQSVILQPELEQNIYANNVFDTNDNKMYDDDDDNDIDNKSRIDTPYEHLIHPYLKRKAMKKNKNRDDSPEIMFSKLNLNGFKMKNKENESVNEWRNSIESQLNSVRNQGSKIDDFCERIKGSTGLGQEIVLAQLRRTIPNNLFKQICDRMNINPYSR